MNNANYRVCEPWACMQQTMGKAHCNVCMGIVNRRPSHILRFHKAGYTVHSQWYPEEKLAALHLMVQNVVNGKTKNWKIEFRCIWVCCLKLYWNVCNSKMVELWLLDACNCLVRKVIHSFTLFSVYSYTGKVPRMWKLSK